MFPTVNGKPRCGPKPGSGECCTIEQPCKLGEGDCRFNEQCEGNLVCGQDNCGPGFHNTSDCCEAKGWFNKSNTEIIMHLI